MSTPARYSPALVEIARTLAGRGALDRDLAAAFGVHLKTIHDWKLRHPDFAEAVRLGKEAADDAVEHALFRKATGYSFESERVFCRNGAIVRVPVTEHVAPSDRAAIFWLTARMPERWGKQTAAAGPRGEGLASLDLRQALIEAKARLAYWRARLGEPALDGDDDEYDGAEPGEQPDTATALDDADPLLHLDGGGGNGCGDGEGAAAGRADPLPGLPGPAAAAPGRGSKYDPAFVALARTLAERGALDRDLARAFGVNLSTLRQWTLRHAGFGAAVRLGKAVADEAVERALFARATGLSYVRERIWLEGDTVLRAELVEHLPPSERAAAFWLSRRRPARWADRPEPESDPARLAAARAESRARIARYHAERKYWRAHGCAPPGSEEPGGASFRFSPVIGAQDAA